MLLRLPYLQNASAWFYSNINDGSYVQWMKDQGVTIPITTVGGNGIDDIRIQFTDPDEELIFKIRWS